jgi:NADPH:quinone reductase-like Zn-dependent oxidoreductase
MKERPMKAIVQDARGEPADVLSLVDMDDDTQPGSGDMLIDVTLAPIHHGDLQLIRSEPNRFAAEGPIRRGSEAVGIVRALGSNVQGQFGLAVGDRVIAFPTAGSWAKHIVVPASAAIPVPADLGDEIAGQLLVNFVTARMILRALRKSVPDEVLREGVVLVTGAGTVVARLLVHLLVQEGLTPIGLTRDAASAERVSAQLQGAAVTAIDGDDWQARVTSLATDKKIVGVLDCVSGPLLADLAPLLADDAAIITYGALGGGKLGIGASEIVGRQFIIRGVVFTRWLSDLSRDEQADDIQAAFAISAALPSLFRTSGIYSLAEIQDAVAAVEAPGRDGFVFLRP